MKRKIFFLFIIMCTTLTATAQTTTIHMKTGQSLQGTFIDANDSTVTILLNDTQPLEIPAARIKDGSLPHGRKILIEDGKVVIKTANEIKAAKLLGQNSGFAGNPNYAIGKALKNSGSASLAIGVPCLAAGLATCIAGRVGGTTHNVIQRANCIEASYYLFSIGASLTIVGIPLYIEGKKIMELNVNYTGNGAGIAMKF